MNKSIEVCPICQSKDIRQKGNLFFGFEKAYCANCGILFKFNTVMTDRLIDSKPKIIRWFFEN